VPLLQTYNASIDQDHFIAYGKIYFLAYSFEDTKEVVRGWG